MAGLAALLGSTFMLCFGTSEAILIVARVLQGISAAVVWTVGLALIVDTVGEARVGSAMAYASSAMSIGLIIGPVLGGVIYARSGYYAAFGLAFAFIGLDLVLRVILVEKKIAIRYQNTPQVSEVSEESPTNIKLETLPGSAVPAETIAAETAEPSSRPRTVSAADSTLPPVIYILRYPRLLVALLLSFNQAIFLSALDATLPLYLNALFGFTAFQAGTFKILADLMLRFDIHGGRSSSILHLTSRRLAMRPLRSQSSCSSRSPSISSLLRTLTTPSCRPRKSNRTSRRPLCHPRLSRFLSFLSILTS